MGTLKPGATYIYEKSNGITYAREFGADPRDRRIIGWDSSEGAGKSLNEIIESKQMWDEILSSAKDNPALQNALNQCILIYNLSKDHGT